MEWHKWDERKPEGGKKIVIVCNDGCSSSLALMTEEGPIDAEDAYDFGPYFTRGAIWAELPGAYGLAFMERHDDY